LDVSCRRNFKKKIMVLKKNQDMFYTYECNNIKIWNESFVMHLV
jgi:hypothetical protein